MQDAVAVDETTEKLVEDFWDTNPGPLTPERFEELVTEGAELLQLDGDLVRMIGKRGVLNTSLPTDPEPVAEQLLAEETAMEEGVEEEAQADDSPTSKIQPAEEETSDKAFPVSPKELKEKVPETPKVEEAKQSALTEKPQITSPKKEKQRKMTQRNKQTTRPLAGDFVKRVWNEAKGDVLTMEKISRRLGYNFDKGTLYAAKARLLSTHPDPQPTKKASKNSSMTKKSTAAKKPKPTVKTTPVVSAPPPPPPAAEMKKPQSTPGQILDSLQAELAEAQKRVDEIKARIRAIYQQGLSAL